LFHKHEKARLVMLEEQKVWIIGFLSPFDLRRTLQLASCGRYFLPSLPWWMSILPVYSIIDNQEIKTNKRSESDSQNMRLLL
jgi:hypothetical protein